MDLRRFAESSFDLLKNNDRKLFELILNEFHRQNKTINLIASENIQPLAATQALMSPFSNKYAEGYPGARYYGGNEVCDTLEIMCQERALSAFNLKKNNWSVNVQALSGSPANLGIFAGILNPGDTILSMSLASGGHLSHGHSSFINKVFNVVQYSLRCDVENDIRTAIIDYDEIERLAKKCKPKIIIFGVSAFPREIDYKRAREICDKVGAYMMADVSHISGLLAAKVLKNSPFSDGSMADIISTTTHKTLRGTRGALIFTSDINTAKKINAGVFPKIQGGPHMNQIAGIAASLNEVNENRSAFKKYQQDVIENASEIGKNLKEKGYRLLTDGTDMHMILIDVNKPNEDDHNDSNQGETKQLLITGKQVESLMDYFNISLNRNSLPGDTSVINTNGIRVGTPTITSRKFGGKDINMVSEILSDIIQQTKVGQLRYHEKMSKTLGEERIKYANAKSPNFIKLLDKDKVEEIHSKVAFLTNKYPLFPELSK